MRAAPLTTVAKLCVALGVTLAATTGCLMPRGGSVFEDTQRRYTQLIRWSEFERAAQMVDPEAKADFTARARELGALHFMDYEVQSVEFDEEGKNATVMVTYDAYQRASANVVSFRERQQWRQDPETKQWVVSPRMEPREYQPETPF
ncbi:MAG: hypothetical protein QNK03_18350 [Myxococcota bacterium]|nr:hypothetical protein [Myxococcota bacterium]